ncbi:MAG: hypothetical protein ACUVT0_02555 [Thermochromatium sp.]
MKSFEPFAIRLPDTAANSIFNPGSPFGALESHLQVLNERLAAIEHGSGSVHELADLRLQIARTLVGLGRGAEAWPLARAAFDHFIEWDQFESAADACDVLFQADQPGSIAALGQGIWLAVTCPIDPELTIELLRHVIDETPDEADGAAVAATTALFLADIRATGRQREDLMFFATQLLGTVARRHSQVETPEQLDQWMERLELKEPERFLVRLRHVVDALVQDDWWFDREALQRRLPY